MKALRVWLRKKPDRKRLDVFLLRWLITLALGVWLIFVFGASNAASPDLNARLASMIFPALLALYMGHLILGRMQFSLLDWCLTVMVLGNATAFLLSSHEASLFGGRLWFLLAVCVAWVLYGAALGVARAELLDCRKALPRAAVVASGWLTTATPALLITAAALLVGQFYPEYVSPSLQAWLPVFLPLALWGLCAEIYLRIRCGRAARKLLAA